MATGAACITGSAGVAQAGDAMRDFSDVYGMPNFAIPSDDLRFLRAAQTLRRPVPKNLAAFDSYL